MSTGDPASNYTRLNSAFNAALNECNLPNNSGLGSYTTGTSTNTTWTDSTWTDTWVAKPVIVELFELYLRGVDLNTEVEQYLEVIKKITGVDGDNLRAIAAFERFRRLVFHEK